jgi:serine O-acetyltransferase
MSATLKKTWGEIKNDLPTKRYSFLKFLYHFFLNPKFRLLLNHRIGKYFYFHSFTSLKPIAIYYKNKMLTKRHCDISYGATIGKRLQFPHPIGIVIGDQVVIKDDVVIFQHVTLGSHGKANEQKSYPIIENNVVIYANSIVVGSVNIGRNAKIGAQSFVINSIPANTTAFGVPATVKIKKS